jgi:hypothetical protein
MAKYFVFEFVGTGVVARARLLEKEAPQTCRILWERLPYEGSGGHAMLSGTICALYIDPKIVVPTENATVNVQKHDLMFTHYDEDTRHGFPEALSEIYWAYDRYVTPTSPGMMAPVYPNVFGEMLAPLDAFYDLSRRIRREGVRPIRVTGATD